MQSYDESILVSEPDTLSLCEARAVLASFSIISVDAKTGNMTMHPLAHAWARDRLDASEIEEATVSAGCVLALCAKYGNSIRAHLQPHVESWWASWSLKPSMVVSGMISCLYLLGTVLVLRESDLEARRIFEFLVSSETFKVTATSRHRDMCCNEIGECYLRASKPRKAIEILENSLRNGKITDGPKDPTTRYLKCQLAKAYFAIGEVRKALELLQVILYSHEQAQANPEALWVLYAQHVLAMCYLHPDIGEPEKAVELLEKLVRVAKTKMKMWNPYRIEYQCNLAEAYLRTNEPNKLITFMEEVVEIEEMDLKMKHPSLLRLQCFLAEAYLFVGKTSQATELLENVVSIHATRLELDASDRIYALRLISEAYSGSGLTEKAIETMKEVVRTMKDILEPDDVIRQASEQWLAKLYLDDGQIDKGIELLEEVVRIRRTTLAPVRLESEIWLGRAYLDKGEINKAIELLEKVIQISMNALPREHRIRMKSEDWLVKAYFDKGETGKEIELLEEIIQIRMKTLPPEHEERSYLEDWLIKA